MLKGDYTNNRTFYEYGGKGCGAGEVVLLLPSDSVEDFRGRINFAIDKWLKGSSSNDKGMYFSFPCKIKDGLF